MEKLMLELFSQWAKAADIIEPIALISSMSGILLYACGLPYGLGMGLAGMMIYSLTIITKTLHEYYARPALILPSDEELSALVAQILAPQIAQLQQALAEIPLHNQRNRFFEIPELKPVIYPPFLRHRHA